MTEGIKLFQEVAKRFSVRYYLNLVLVDEEDRRYFKQQVSLSLSVVIDLPTKATANFNLGNHPVEKGRAQ